MVIALAALLAMGPARDRTSVAEPASEGDSAEGLDRIDTASGGNWALPRERRAKREPVSEL
jgi:hypothetical protein